MEVESEFLIFHLELGELENLGDRQEEEDTSDDLLNLIKVLIRDRNIIIIKFDIENGLDYIKTIIHNYPIYNKILTPLVEYTDIDYELAFRLFNSSIFVEIINNIVIEKSIDNFMKLSDFDDFCYLVKDIANFTIE